MATAKRAKNINKADAGEPSDDQSISQNELTRAEIEKRAYAIYLSRGEVHVMTRTIGCKPSTSSKRLRVSSADRVMQQDN